ncbi:MAG: response regulator transcription factor [Ignavibacteria bacterium]|nr:response regulator transcription factor [Ignavibacteria bacterium]
MKVFIIEDEAPSINWLTERLHKVEPNVAIIGVAHSIKEAVTWLETTTTEPDLIFMDIQLTDGLSFEIFRQSFVRTPIIFTTAFDSYVLEAFKLHSIDYLLKPVNTNELRRSLTKYHEYYAVTHTPPVASAVASADSLPEAENIHNFIQKVLHHTQKEPPKRLLVQRGSKFISLQADDIAYCYAEQRLAYIVTHDNKRYLKGDSLDELQAMLPTETFFRINRQYLAHIRSIAEVQALEHGKLNVQISLASEPSRVVLNLTVSRDRAGQFKEWFGA